MTTPTGMLTPAANGVRWRGARRFCSTVARVCAPSELAGSPLGDTPGSKAMPASVGIAGVNTRPLHAATPGVAGNWGSTVRPYLEHVTAPVLMASGTRLGDRAARTCWDRAAYLFQICCDQVGWSPHRVRALS